MGRPGIASADQKVADDIRKHGWHSLYVFSTTGEQPFNYSIGFGVTYGAPEVLVFGLDRSKSHPLLAECATLLRAGQSLRSGVPDARVLAGDYKVFFKEVRRDAFPEYLGTALRYYGDKSFSALVMFLPDAQHRFPWDSGYGGIDATEQLAIV